MSIITSTDFVNKFELSTGMYSTAKIDDYIARYQERYLVDRKSVV